MLIRFTVKNFLSFKDETEFSMIPGRGTDRKKHIILPKKTTEIPLLCSGIIYGANASGKSNLIKAVDEAKKIILSPLKQEEMLPDFRFKLDPKSKNGITKFEFEIKANGKKYAYGFSFSPEKIEEEWLFIIKNKETETPVFERTKEILKINKKVIKNNKEFERIEFIAEDLFPNQLFLSIVNNRNISTMKYSKSFIEVHKWFEESLITIFPNAKFMGHPLLGDENGISNFLSDLLNNFDTGISKIEFNEIPFENIYKTIPEFVIKDIKSKLRPGENIIVGNQKNDLFYFTKSENGIEVKELVAFHNNNNKEPFELSEESDGTNRLIDILPLFLLLNNNNSIFIDEIDRSLHSELTYKFMDIFLHFAAENKTQIVATTHDTALLDLELFRKDEIWFVEKDKKGASKIYSLDQFAPRADLNIRKGYLNGRFGAIPFFGKNLDSFVDSFNGAK